MEYTQVTTALNRSALESNQKTQSTTIMIQGTTSDAGKSTLVTGLCRLFARQHINVAPFKPQNMALNSAVTVCGGEIGRAQAVQAKAAKLPLEVDFNPILLKPNSDTGAQVIIHGKAISDMEAEQYHDYKKVAMEAVLTSHQRLKAKHQLIVVEGAGSPAEINLREGDIANMGFAEAVDCPVIIIADIDKGGVFAQLVGTLMLLSQTEQDRVVGFVINRFRGDLSLLTSGLTWLEEKTNKPVLGVLPYLHGLEVASEDAIVTTQPKHEQKTAIKVIVLIYPRVSNHTDFDALRLHDEIDCQFIFAKDEAIKSAEFRATLPPCDLIILPGSKNVRADLAFLRSQGWDKDIAKHLRYGGKVFGICGGYQMLGELINDPQGIESQPGQSVGLGYLPINTELHKSKTLTNVKGTLSLLNKTVEVSGYEIHAGVSQLTTQSLCKSLLSINNTEEGLISDDGQVAGCYLHGLFDQSAALSLIAQWVGGQITQSDNIADREDLAIEKLANACEQHLDIKKIKQIIADWSSQ